MTKEKLTKRDMIILADSMHMYLHWMQIDSYKDARKYNRMIPTYAKIQRIMNRTFAMPHVKINANNYTKKNSFEELPPKIEHEEGEQTK